MGHNFEKIIEKLEYTSKEIKNYGFIIRYNEEDFNAILYALKEAHKKQNKNGENKP